MHDAYKAEIAVEKANAQVALAKAALKAAGHKLYLSGVIDGKNAEIRDAQVWDGTTSQREALELAEEALLEAKIALLEAKARYLENNEPTLQVVWS